MTKLGIRGQLRTVCADRRDQLKRADRSMRQCRPCSSTCGRCSGPTTGGGASTPPRHHRRRPGLPGHGPVLAPGRPAGNHNLHRHRKWTTRHASILIKPQIKDCHAPVRPENRISVVAPKSGNGAWAYLAESLIDQCKQAPSTAKRKESMINNNHRANDKQGNQCGAGGFSEHASHNQQVVPSA